LFALSNPAHLNEVGVSEEIAIVFSIGPKELIAVLAWNKCLIQKTKVRIPKKAKLKLSRLA
jgi:hypothetical protein